MSTARDIPEAVTALQTQASDPGSSAWVAANAGSGKTHVLAQRVIRLLLSGVDPARILCITFTKAAAANMANRVFNELRSWTLMDDAALDKAMRKAGEQRIDADRRRRARRLFALALDTPGGLKVHTIHAFCTQLLHLFPFEANVAARFEVLDETQENQLLEQLSLDVMMKAADAPDSPLGRALGQAVLAAADVTFRDLVREVIRQRDKLMRWVEAAGGVPQAMEQLAQSLGVTPTETVAQAEARIFSESMIASSEWAAISAAFLTSDAKGDQDQAARFKELAKLNESERLETYLDIFCTSARDKVRDRPTTGKIQKAYPDLCRQIGEERDRVWTLFQHKRALEARDRSTALFTIAHAVIERFRADKDRRGLLDYEDLIGKTLDLLNNVSAAWVHYKLDRGIHHVLIDEAQDTSPKQWEIVKALVGEFFAGEGAHDRRRTIFAVGDEKQSIFSFQGAAPREFAEMRNHFDRLHKSARLDFVSTEFKHSFRSGENVLGAVDAVFSPPAAHKGLTALPQAPVHEALPQAAPGLAEIWDTTKTDERKDITPWDAPFDTERSASGVVKLAKRIAGHVALWRSQGRLAKDVLILVRRRGVLFESIIRALKNEGVPVAGADRLMLTEHIAVMDLMVLADALLLPQDDLALATVLKSPLFGLDEDELFRLAHDRKTSLRSVLRTQRPDISVRLDALREQSCNTTPFTFYASLLGAGHGRQQLLGRLGHEAADALDEFLNLALDYERTETPSLQGFIAWLRAAQAEVKRDMEMERDEVRVMTAHGAKGLEAPIVILADTTTPPQGFHPPRLLQLPAGGSAPSAAPPLVWAVAKANDVGPMAAAREAALNEARDEHRRLLYVGMTRAIERLIVCGVDGINKRPDGCWYDLARGALEPYCVTEQADDGAGDVLRYRKIPDAAIKRAAGEPSESSVTIPVWLTQTLGPAPEYITPIKPSGFVDDPIKAGLPGARDARRRAIARGNIVHRLMQSLPDIPEAARAEAAHRHIDRQRTGQATDFTASEADEIVRQVLGIIADPRFAALFSPGSRAEVPIVGQLNGRPVAGVVDRLVVTADAVLIADYKTNRLVPAGLAETQAKYQGYIKQLSHYRAVLERLYPDRPIRAALVWTAHPRLAEIPAQVLDAALAGDTGP
jgi:ATP-dependent helicase/nuclease subunit A